MVYPVYTDIWVCDSCGDEVGGGICFSCGYSCNYCYYCCEELNAD